MQHYFLTEAFGEDFIIEKLTAGEYDSILPHKPPLGIIIALHDVVQDMSQSYQAAIGCSLREAVECLLSRSIPPPAWSRIFKRTVEPVLQHRLKLLTETREGVVRGFQAAIVQPFEIRSHAGVTQRPQHAVGSR
jgi:hypothetical protein